jgi:cob(I)alamin adenosyltransferase
MTRKSRIYTRTGDTGETSLIGGRRVRKYHERIEAYGTVDELIAHTGLLRDLTEDESVREELTVLMGMQMAAASQLASEMDAPPEGLPEIGEKDILFLESRIDEMDASLQPLTSFVIPGGHPAVSQAHVARTVCRRAERVILKLHERDPVGDEIIRFFNRLGDYFFVLSRKLADNLGVEQSPWKPEL